MIKRLLFSLFLIGILLISMTSPVFADDDIDGNKSGGNNWIQNIVSALQEKVEQFIGALSID